MRGDLKGLGIGAIGGLIGSGAVLALYFIALANTQGADGGDWLAFAGVAVGVFATISGTLAIERLKERRTTRAALANMGEAVGIYIGTVNNTPANLNPAQFADLRQQHAYISHLSGELAGASGRQRMAAHLFSFHAPAMVARLERSLTEFEGAAQIALVNYIVGEMRSYAMTLQGVLSEE